MLRNRVGYNIPQSTGIVVSVDLFKRLNQLEHFNYIKDSAGDMIRQQEYLATGYMVLNGCDPNTVFSFIAGAQGCIWGGANYMPRESVRLYELVASKDIDGAMELWSRMIPSLLLPLERQLCFQGQGCLPAAWLRRRWRARTAAESFGW